MIRRYGEGTVSSTAHNVLKKYELYEHRECAEGPTVIRYNIKFWMIVLQNVFLRFPL